MELIEYLESFNDDNVSDIIESEIEENLIDTYMPSILPIFPCDLQEQIETLDEFIQKYCEIEKNAKIYRPLVYEEFNNYISQTGFIWKNTFYNKIESDYPFITRSITCPEFFNGIKIKPCIIKDIHVYIRDFLHLKCEFRSDYRINSEQLSDEFIKFIKDDDSKISEGQIKKLGLHKVNCNSILKNDYPFKFQYISKHKEGWCGLKLKSQNINELSDLVQTFYNTKIEKTLGNHINRRPVFHYFLEWYNENYSSIDIPKSWTNSLFREEFKKYVKFSGYKWKNIKLI